MSLPLAKVASVAVFALCLAHAPQAHAVVQGTPVSEAEQIEKGLVTILSSSGAICSGALITNAWMITAGHCVIANRTNPSALQVRLVTPDLNSKNSQTINVQAIYLFGGFSDEVGPDLAVLHLRSPLSINNSTSGFVNQIWTGGRNAVFGKTVAFYGQGFDSCANKSSGRYLATDLIVDSDLYQARVRPTDPAKPPGNTNYFKEASGPYYRAPANAKARVPWQGDSGGGAFVFSNNTRYLIGIQSGASCGVDVYQVNLPPLRDWIYAVFASQWTPGAQSQSVYVYPSEVNGTGWGLRDVNAVHWAQAARAAAAMCYNRGFAGGHFDGHQGPLPPSKQPGFGIQCSGGDTQWRDVTQADIAKSGWTFTDINTVGWAQAGRAAERICTNLKQGFAGGQFNGHMRGGNFGLFCYRGGAQWFDATDKEIAATGFGFPTPRLDDNLWAQAARAAVGYCRSKGFSGGFMNGHQVPGKYGVVCQK
jgi:hypothetical protein